MRWQGIVALAAFALPSRTLAQQDTASARASRDSILLTQFGPTLLGTLHRLADAQTAYRASHGRYSATLAALEPPAFVPRGVNVAVLRADSAAWRAVGVHDSMPGLECRMTGGSPTAVPEDTTPGRLLCRTPRHSVLALRDTATAFQLPPPGQHQRPAITRSCARWTLTPQMRMRLHEPHRVLLQFILGPEGKPEVPGLTVLESVGGDYTRVALEILEKCRFEPAQTSGKPIRVLISLPIDVRP